MTQILNSVKDEDFGFLQIEQNKNNAIAIRNFEEQCKDPKNEQQMKNHGNKITFWQLGTFDEDTGEIIPDLKLLEKASSFFHKSPVEQK